MMQILTGILALIAWLLWFAPFVRTPRAQAKPDAVDHRGRWGMFLQLASFVVLGLGPRASLDSWWRPALASVFFTLGIVLAWAAPRALGKQWRIEAALSPDHQLVTSGPYRILRHPIYASVICMLLGTGLMRTPLPRLAAALVLCAAGTEIRVR